MCRGREVRSCGMIVFCCGAFYEFLERRRRETPTFHFPRRVWYYWAEKRQIREEIDWARQLALTSSYSQRFAKLTTLIRARSLYSSQICQLEETFHLS